jgi:hypothetical protein
MKAHRKNITQLKQALLDGGLSVLVFQQPGASHTARDAVKVTGCSRRSYGSTRLCHDEIIADETKIVCGKNPGDV